MTKPIADYYTMVDSLMNLRDEIAETYSNNGAVVNEILYKINSCLFSEYPHNREEDDEN